jgi:hypothetical protein
MPTSTKKDFARSREVEERNRTTKHTKPLMQLNCPRAERAQQWRFAPGALPDGQSGLVCLVVQHSSYFLLRDLRGFA